MVRRDGLAYAAKSHIGNSSYGVRLIFRGYEICLWLKLWCSVKDKRRDCSVTNEPSEYPVTLTPAEDNEGERFLSSIEPVSVCGLQQCGFAQVMPITDGETLAG